MIIRPFPHNLPQSLTNQIKDPKLHESERDYKNKCECSQWSSNTCNNLWIWPLQWYFRDFFSSLILQSCENNKATKLNQHSGINSSQSDLMNFEMEVHMDGSKNLFFGNLNFRTGRESEQILEFPFSFSFTLYFPLSTISQ